MLEASTDRDPLPDDWIVLSGSAVDMLTAKAPRMATVTNNFKIGDISSALGRTSLKIVR